jgi:hypothetical protein
MILTSVILADYATIREGVLNVLGGGINKLQKPSFPARMSATVALMVKPESGDDVRGEHVIEVGITKSSANELIAEVQLKWSGFSATEDLPVPLPAIPIVVPTDDISLPYAGLYSLFVRLDGAEAGRLEFVATQAGDPPGAPNAHDSHSVKNLA